jgi:hypothetical protein
MLARVLRRFVACLSAVNFLIMLSDAAIVRNRRLFVVALAVEELATVGQSVRSWIGRGTRRAASHGLRRGRRRRRSEQEILRRIEVTHVVAKS